MRLKSNQGRTEIIVVQIVVQCSDIIGSCYMDVLIC